MEAHLREWTETAFLVHADRSGRASDSFINSGHESMAGGEKDGSGEGQCLPAGATAQSEKMSGGWARSLGVSGSYARGH